MHKGEWQPKRGRKTKLAPTVCQIFSRQARDARACKHLARPEHLLSCTARHAAGCGGQDGGHALWPGLKMRLAYK